MARVLIIGCGCRGQELTRELRKRGHVVRGTTRSDARLAAIEAAGAEGAIADPERLGTVLPHLQGVSAVCWLAGDSPRLEALAETLIDTHARGLVCEPGPGAERARRVAEANKVGFETVREGAPLADAVERMLGG
jgi:nucleoside-diphosphate-sugar epimerase